MPSKKERDCYFVLTLWAGPTAHTMAEGYVFLQNHYRDKTGQPISDGEAHGKVRRALEYYDINPRTPNAVPRAWHNLHTHVFKAEKLA